MFRVADLFCGAGGAAMGLHRALEKAGIEHKITGVDIDWMTGKELTQAIPPAYSCYLMEQYLKQKER